MIIDYLIECQKDKNIQVWNGIDWIPSIFAEYKGKDPWTETTESHRQSVYRAIRGLKKRGLVVTHRKYDPWLRRSNSIGGYYSKIALIEWEKYSKCLSETEITKHLEPED